MSDNTTKAPRQSWAPLHEGEKKAQSLVGVREAVRPWAPKIIQPFMSEEHRHFYSQLPFIVVASRDEGGAPWATILFGAPGFVGSPEPKCLKLTTKPIKGDVLEESFVLGAEVGLLGIDLETRRRNRVNGILSAIDNGGFTVTVEQSFGNCPQYISKRVWHAVKVNPSNTKSTNHSRLNGSMQSWIEGADTLFIASGYRKSQQERTCDGMDISHRGGSAGFVKIVSPTQLVVPDYAGNNLFNTIGNLVMDSRVGVLFVDFENGNLLQITGNAIIDWDSPEISKHTGAQRLINIQIDRVVQLDNVLPLKWDAPEGTIRELRVLNKIRESEDVISFEFVPRDDGDLAAFKAGQYLPIELRINENDSVERTYSLSNPPGEDRYRISVKREPQGLVSRLLHDRVNPGDIIYAQEPEGEFVLTDTNRPVALISAGIGITPMVSMLHTLAKQDRQVHFIHSARDGNHNPLSREVREIAANHDRVDLQLLFSKPRPEDIEGQHFHRQGHIDIVLIEECIPELDADFFICGPKQFIADIAAQLVERGVEAKNIMTEDFKY